ncbi:MAG: hypothetical protein ABSG25_12275, partial [Bryobacteraceae bacterium]
KEDIAYNNYCLDQFRLLCPINEESSLKLRLYNTLSEKETGLIEVNQTCLNALNFFYEDFIIEKELKESKNIKEDHFYPGEVLRNDNGQLCKIIKMSHNYKDVAQFDSTGDGEEDWKLFGMRPDYLYIAAKNLRDYDSYVYRTDVNSKVLNESKTITERANHYEFNKLVQLFVKIKNGQVDSRSLIGFGFDLRNPLHNNEERIVSALSSKLNVNIDVEDIYDALHYLHMKSLSDLISSWIKYTKEEKLIKENVRKIDWNTAKRMVGFNNEGLAYVLYHTIENIVDKRMEPNKAFTLACENENYYGDRADIIKERNKVVQLIKAFFKIDVKYDERSLKEEKENRIVKAIKESLILEKGNPADYQKRIQDVEKKITDIKAKIVDMKNDASKLTDPEKKKSANERIKKHEDEIKSHEKQIVDYKQGMKAAR